MFKGILKQIEEKSIPRQCTIRLYDLVEEESSKKTGLEGNIKNEASHGYAGFLKRKDLKDHLTTYIEEKKIKSLVPQKQKIIEVLIDIYSQCKKIVPQKGILYVYVFPSNTDFVSKRMHGITGHTVYKNCIHIFLSPSTAINKKALRETFAHEYAHTISMNYHEWNTLEDSVVFEGIAEVFRESATKGDVDTLHITDISDATYKKALEYIVKNAKKTSKEIYNNLFFGSKLFRVWTGYRVGYRLVSEYISSTGSALEEVLKEEPQNILNQKNKSA